MSNMDDDRYQRQRKVIGHTGQQKLKNSSVFIVGCGGLGCPIALYLVGAGIGKITMIDDDVVSLSNLHRQILFSESEIGQLKVDVAKKRLQQLNAEVEIISISQRLDEHNIANYLNGHDLVIVGCDNLTTRYITNDTCSKMSIPYINASVLGDEGSISFFDIDNGCYRCIFPDPLMAETIPSPDDMGVLGASVGVIGTATATMAIEILIGNQSNYLNKIFTFDSLTLKMKSFSFSKDKQCLSCSA